MCMCVCERALCVCVGVFVCVCVRGVFVPGEGYLCERGSCTGERGIAPGAWNDRSST